MNIDASKTGGPKTMVALFAYGGVVPQTACCICRDIAYAATITGMYSAAHEQARYGAIMAGPLGRVRAWELSMNIPPGDALIDRCRGITAKEFLKTSNDVLVMVDHDMEWRGAGLDHKGRSYEGDLLHVAAAAVRLKGIVGAVVCKKARGEGVAIIWKEPKVIELGEEEFTEVHQIGAAFTAYPRSVIQAVSDTMEEVPPGFKPVFLPAVAAHPLNPKEMLHLSEDWAFVARAQALGIKAYAASRPMITHWGPYGYTVAGDSQSKPDGGVSPHGGWPAVQRTQPGPVSNVALTNDAVSLEQFTRQTSAGKPVKISVIHPTRGRPEMATESYKRRMAAISGAYNIEYIFAVDDDDETMKDWTPPGVAKVVRGTSRGPVDAYNRALWAATGDVVAQAHDDLYPPKDWDKLIVQALGDLSQPRVLHVDDGCSANPDKPWLLTVLNGTMAWFRKAGYFYWPGYPAMMCDDDVSRKAEREGAIIAAKHIKYQHAWGGPEADETYKRAYTSTNWDEGRKVFAEREAAGFPDAPEMWTK